MKNVLSLVRPASLLVLFLAATSATAFYDPTIGKWISRDPIGERGGLNLNGFVDNGPIGYVDELGLRYGNPVSGPSGPIGPSVPTDPDIILNPPLPKTWEMNYNFFSSAKIAKCNIVIFVGHYTTTPHWIWQPPCSGATMIGCMGGGGYDKDHGYVPPKQFDPFPGATPPEHKMINQFEAHDRIIADLAAAETYAGDLCKKNCCKEIAISVLCDFGTGPGSAAVQKAVDPDGSLCGKSKIVQCP